MKKLIYITSACFIFSCTEAPEQNKNTTPNPISKDSSQTVIEEDSISIPENNIAISKHNILDLTERFNGPATIKDKNNGKEIFMLNDHVSLETGPSAKGTLEVGLWIDLNQTQVENGYLLPKTAIYQKKKQIGSSTDTVFVMMSHDNQGFIMGFANEQNIKQNTVPENVLVQLIQEGKRSKSDFTPFMNALKFDIDETWNDPSLEVFMIYETTVVDPSPLDRITLLFKENQLVAINNSRDLQIKGFDSHKLDRDYRLTVIQNLSKDEIKKLITERNEFLNSVD